MPLLLARWLGGMPLLLARWLGGTPLLLARWLGGTPLLLARWLGGTPLSILFGERRPRHLGYIARARGPRVEIYDEPRWLADDERLGSIDPEAGMHRHTATLDDHIADRRRTH
jgi:hypothetical protein